MSKKSKILVIGAGGIGSYLIEVLNRTECYDIVVADPDSVEDKNIYSQNYENEDCGISKVYALLKGAELRTRTKYPILTDKQLNGYDLIICCADNLDVRRLLYRKGFQSDCAGKWLDLRAQGRNCAYISYRADRNKHDVLLAGPEGSFSCQGDSWDGTNSNVHFMQVAIAGLGAQWVQRFFNDEDVREYMVVNV